MVQLTMHNRKHHIKRTDSHKKKINTHGIVRHWINLGLIILTVSSNIKGIKALLKLKNSPRLICLSIPSLASTLQQ